MSSDITFTMSPWQWGDAYSWDKVRGRVPTVAIGKDISFILTMNLMEVLWHGHRVLDARLPESDFALGSLGERANFCYFKGKVVRIWETPYQTKLVGFEGTKWVNVSVDCGVGLWLIGQMPERSTLDFHEGSVIGGVGHLWGDVDERSYGKYDVPLKGRVTFVQERGPIPLAVKEEGYPLISVALLNADAARASFDRVERKTRG